MSGGDGESDWIGFMTLGLKQGEPGPCESHSVRRRWCSDVLVAKSAL